MVWLIANRRLLPAIVMVGSFALFVLWMVGLIATSVELWGSGGVQSNCNLQVFNQSPSGKDLETLAWLQQRTICKCIFCEGTFRRRLDVCLLSFG